ncbi:hypothetical protein H1R20_g6264, partial [Candolleomyces eurysporus]
MDQLGEGNLIPGINKPELALEFRSLFLEAEKQITLVGLGSGIETAEAAELFAGAANLAEAVELEAGFGEWMLALLGVLAAGVSPKPRAGEIDLSTTKEVPLVPLSEGQLDSLARAEFEAARAGTVAAMGGTATYSMTWINGVQDAGTSFTIKQWYLSGGPFCHSTMAPSPPGTVFEVNSTQSLAWYNSTFGGEPLTNGFLVIQTPKGYVGVNIHVPAKVFGFGTPPYYQVFWGNSADDIDWKTPVDNPAQPYTFPTDAIGYKIRIAPVASDSTLTLTVTLQHT